MGRYLTFLFRFRPSLGPHTKRQPKPKRNTQNRKIKHTAKSKPETEKHHKPPKQTPKEHQLTVPLLLKPIEATNRGNYSFEPPTPEIQRTFSATSKPQSSQQWRLQSEQSSATRFSTEIGTSSTQKHGEVRLRPSKTRV
ncbi:hypothetical protein ES319_A05G358500v1 [Gossypium barbadense]|uniref:Uncharacterized protein n=3 Tax=Gossypium TaxID=3633 RepID=A0A5J5VYS9_GOSBA|nr:hypothetical protein ES319_A05G358500v1 [Gossypium barbadense]TYH19776.1 hypothetical protein ES288_A05G378800v1 [Gossypium darwinii]TYI30437.1 hypothetical protein ES332_A05G387700v1 [Gossypium tomentosum]